MLRLDIGTSDRANAEYITRWAAVNNIIRVGVPNERRLSGLICNFARANMYVRYGKPKQLTANDPYICIPPGANADMPPLFTGAIFAVWDKLDPIGYAVLHHYYHES